MAERNPPLHLQAGSHPANNDRRFLEQLTGLRPGIFKEGDLAVTQTATPSMAVSVAAGAAIVDGSEVADQGVYFVDSDGPKVLPIAAADATNARFDMIVARVRDAAYSGASNAWALEVVQGSPASSPVEPSIPANSLVLARVSVPAGASSIVNANITDRRTTTAGQGRVTVVGGRVICTSATRPTVNLYEGLEIYETDTDKSRTWDGSTWVETDDLGAWDSYTPTLTAAGTNPTLGTGSNIAGRYRQIGKTVNAEITIVFGSSGAAAGSGQYFVSLPVAAATGTQSNHAIGTAFLLDNSTSVREVAVVRLDSDTTRLIISSHGATGNVTSAIPWAWGNNDQMRLLLTYEAA